MSDAIQENEWWVKKRFEDTRFTLLLVGVSLLLAIMYQMFVTSEVMGLSDILVYFLLLIPLAYASLRPNRANPYTRWFVLPIALWIVDIFIYNNDLTQNFLPSLVVISIFILYLTHNHTPSALYQILIPKGVIPLAPILYLKTLLSHFVTVHTNDALYKRIVIGLVITVPFIALFLALFIDADPQFRHAIDHLLQFLILPSLEDLIMIPLYFFLFLWFFIYGFLNRASRNPLGETQPFDVVIVGIFLGMLNLLFVTFLTFQVGYLFGGESYLHQTGIEPSTFARQGFFQLAWVMGLVVGIFFVVMHRFKGEFWIKILMSALMGQTIIIGIASLKKMVLYQTLLGVTPLRYYVEWFEYFILIILVIGIAFTLLQKSFTTIINTVIVCGVGAFSVVASINIDYCVAKHNVEQFQTKPQALDTQMIANLSLDALPIISTIPNLRLSMPIRFRDSCDHPMSYHWGACHLITHYGENHFYYKGEPYDLPLLPTTRDSDGNTTSHP